MSLGVVLCTGILRSGSTWSFNVCRLMAKVVAGRERTPMWSGYMLANQTEQFFQTTGHPPGPTIIKTHGLGPIALEKVRTEQAKSVCTYRDPRDCVASLMTFTGQYFEEAVESIRGTMGSLDEYRKAGNTHFIRYEQMLDDSLGQVRGIADFLGVTIEEPMLARIDEKSNLESSKKVCEDLRHRPAGEFMRSAEDHRVDPQTWLHHNHIHSGQVGRWREEMSPQQAQELNRVFAPWLERLGYVGAPANKRAG
jgi:hypothetical protein